MISDTRSGWQSREASRRLASSQAALYPCLLEVRNTLVTLVVTLVVSSCSGALSLCDPAILSSQPLLACTTPSRASTSVASVLEPAMKL